MLLNEMQEAVAHRAKTTLGRLYGFCTPEKE